MTDEITITPPNTVVSAGCSPKATHTHTVAATVSTGANTATSEAGANRGAEE